MHSSRKCSIQGRLTGTLVLDKSGAGRRAVRIGSPVHIPGPQQVAL